MIEWTPAHVEALSASISALIFFATAVAGLKTYRDGKRKERIEKNFEVIQAFIGNKASMDVQSKIQSEDASYTEVLNLLNDEAAKGEEGNVHRNDLLNKSQSDIRQEIDNYLNYLEAIASLFKRDWLLEDDWAGFWNYYFRQINRYTPLCNYTQNLDYEWDLLVESTKMAVHNYKSNGSNS